VRFRPRRRLLAILQFTETATRGSCLAEGPCLQQPSIATAPMLESIPHGWNYLRGVKPQSPRAAYWSRCLLGTGRARMAESNGPYAV